MLSSDCIEHWITWLTNTCTVHKYSVLFHNLFGTLLAVPTQACCLVLGSDNEPSFVNKQSFYIFLSWGPITPPSPHQILTVVQDSILHISYSKMVQKPHSRIHERKAVICFTWHRKAWRIKMANILQLELLHFWTPSIIQYSNILQNTMLWKQI
jgi:hypothetical protein